MLVEARPGSTVLVKLTGTIIEGRFGTIIAIEPKRQRWPELYVILLDVDWPDPELVDELHLAYDEFQVIA